MSIDTLIDNMRAQENKEAVAVGDEVINYRQLVDRFTHWQAKLREFKVPSGAVVSIKSDYSTDAISLLLALADNNNVIVPLSTASRENYQTFSDIAEVEYEFDLQGGDRVPTVTGRQVANPLYEELRSRNAPGLVLFSSGSTGKSKGILHDFNLILKKFEVPRKTMRMLLFLQFDHIGGINTLLYVLFNGGMAVIPSDRRPEGVCHAIEKFKAQVLPTSPTFLNLLLLTRAYEKHDISSLSLVTYGTEPMPQSTLERVAELFPQVKMQQTYGLSEVGILRSKSRDSKSLWVKVGGDEFQTKIVEGKLWIKSQSAMLGYLNAPSPFDEEGFLNTGDLVEQDGEWLKILGRESEMINVGGEKVYPAEIESVILDMEGVEDVVIRAEKHSLTGTMVVADVKLSTDETLKDFKVRLRQFCQGRLEPYKVPKKINLSSAFMHNERFKRIRNKPHVS